MALLGNPAIRDRWTANSNIEIVTDFTGADMAAIGMAMARTAMQSVGCDVPTKFTNVTLMDSLHVVSYGPDIYGPRTLNVPSHVIHMHHA